MRCFPRPRSAAALGATLLAALIVVAPSDSTAEPDPAYWRLADVEAQLAQWAADHPTLVHRDTLGTSGEGAPIPLVCVSDHAAVREREPGLLIHAAQHANECNGTTAVMATIARLLDGYGVDPAVTARVDGLELWFAPVVNVDGHHVVFSDASYGADWRKTLRDNDGDDEIDFPRDGVDPNRNWDWRWQQCDETDPASQKYKGPFPFSEAEVRALRDFVLRERPLLVVDYHSPVTISWSNEIFYVWLGSPDFAIAQDIAHEWAAATRDRDGDPYGAIFAYDTLPKEQCWVYGNTGILTYLVEIEDRCWFTGAVVDTIGERVARGSMTLLDRALAGPGLRGRVTSAQTGEPLAAEVIVDELHDPALGQHQADVANGEYHRLTGAGTYTVRVSYRDHEDQSREVAVTSGWAVADFALQPLATAAGEPAADLELWAPNPARGGQHVRLRLPAGAAVGRADLHDLRGRRVATLGAGLAPDRGHRLVLPRGLADGVYVLRVRAGSRASALRLVYVE